MGVGLAIILFVGFGAFSSLFTTESEVLDVAWSGLLVRKTCSNSSELDTHVLEKKLVFFFVIWYNRTERKRVSVQLPFYLLIYYI